MRQVQTALSSLGIPVIAGIWRATTAEQNSPAQYVVYSTTKTEASLRTTASLRTVPMCT
jgi:hypothetical protein